MYRALGKLFVKAAGSYMRLRYARQIRFAIGFGLVSLILGGYLASRSVKEG
jgi:hypothetical protein